MNAVRPSLASHLRPQRSANAPVNARAIYSATAGHSPASSTSSQESAAANAAKAAPAAAPAQPHSPAAQPGRRVVLQQIAAVSAALTMHSLRCTPPAAASAAADAAESAVASCTGCVASVTAVPSGTRAVLGEQPLGSGIVWDSQGFIVVPYAPLTRVQRQGTAGDPQVFVNLTAADGSVCQRLPASIVSKDASHELVVLQIVPPAGGLRPVVLASSSAVRVGQDAYLLAALPDGSPSIAAGVVSGLGRTIPASNNQAISGVVQSDAEVNAQSLGGALLDAAGSLVGMPVVSFIKPGSGRSSGVNFALPSDLLLEVVPRLIVYGSAAVRR